MRYLRDLTRRPSIRLLAASALVIGVGGGTMAASSAGAADPCSTTAFTAGGCSVTGTATLNPGSLGIEAPAQSWTPTLNGANQEVVGTAASFTAQDATGSGAGWNVTAVATQFTGPETTAPNTLAATGTLVFNGSASSETTGATPGNVCAPLTTCTVASPSVGLPVDFTQDGATPETLFNAGTGSGMGNIVIGTTAAPAAWWLNVPASATADTYTSTITLTIASGPGT